MKTEFYRASIFKKLSLFQIFSVDIQRGSLFMIIEMPSFVVKERIEPLLHVQWA